MVKIRTWYKLPENIEFFRGNDGLFYFRIIAKNGQTVAVSEGYTRRWSVIKGARTAIKLLKEK